MNLKSGGRAGGTFPVPPVLHDESRIRVDDVLAPPGNALIAGTHLYTQDGALPVEVLGAGDRVITRDAGMIEVAAMRFRRVTARLVQVAEGALGPSMPGCTTRLLATQQVLLRDWRAEALEGRTRALVAAERLIDGEFIRYLGTKTVTVAEISFGEPHILYADGIEVASWVEQPVLTKAH